MDKKYAQKRTIFFHFLLTSEKDSKGVIFCTEFASFLRALRAVRGFFTFPAFMGFEGCKKES